MVAFQTRYIQQLKADIAKANADRLLEEARAKRKLTDIRVSECWTPLSEQIEKLILRMPQVLRDRPICLDELRARLIGKYQKNPSAGDIGLVLRSLGYIRKRDWSNEAAGRRLWYRDLTSPY